MPTIAERLSGNIRQELDFGVFRIRDGIHFQAKEESPFLQIADAVAYAFRRYFSGQKDGDVFIEAALGFAPKGPEWDNGESGGTYRWRKD